MGPVRGLPASCVVVMLALACASEREKVSFSERPALREETVEGCGGGALRYLVPERALPALRSAAREQLRAEPPFDVESERIPCETCDARGGICGYVVVRYRAPHDGRAGLRLRFRSTVVRSTTSWHVLDSERVFDEARLMGGLSFDEARAALDWTRTNVPDLQPVDSVASVKDLYEAEAPRRAELRLAQIARVDEGSVRFRYLYLRREGQSFVVVGERTANEQGALPPAVRGEEAPDEEPSTW